MSYNRKKTASQGGGFGGGQQRSKQRFSHGGQNNRPRKNYGALREKYLTQARDALAAGDRVLAENYFQHADHCFRMFSEEQAVRLQRNNSYNRRDAHNNKDNESAVENMEDESDDSLSEDEHDDENKVVSALPAFITSSYSQPKKGDGEQESASDWEEE